MFRPFRLFFSSWYFFRGQREPRQAWHILASRITSVASRVAVSWNLCILGFSWFFHQTGRDDRRGRSRRRCAMLSQEISGVQPTETLMNCSCPTKNNNIMQNHAKWLEELTCHQHSPAMILVWSILHLLHLIQSETNIKCDSHNNLRRVAIDWIAIPQMSCCFWNRLVSIEIHWMSIEFYWCLLSMQTMSMKVQTCSNKKRLIHFVVAAGDFTKTSRISKSQGLSREKANPQTDWTCLDCNGNVLNFCIS